jgi:choline/glycine/proline betaine transport protein
MATKPALMNLPIETSDAGFYSGFSKDVTISAKILVSELIIWGPLETGSYPPKLTRENK